jgi:hypothetical protein
VAVTSRDRDEDARRASKPVPWHNRTSTLLGASVVALAAIAILIASASWVSRQFGEPQQAPLNFVDPSFSPSIPRSSSRSGTTGTITSTSPPVTTDINAESTTPSSSASSSASDTPSPPVSTRPPRTREDDGVTTTRKRPRTNVTRTLYPAP